MTDVEFMILAYALYCIVVIIYMAYMLWKHDYIKQALNITVWMSSVSLFEVLILTYVRQ